MFLLILTLDIFLNFVVFFHFGALIGWCFLGRGNFQKVFWGVVLNLLFSVLPSIITFVFFLAQMGYFGSPDKVQQMFWGVLMYLNNFYYLCFLPC